MADKAAYYLANRAWSGWHTQRLVEVLTPDDRHLLNDTNTRRRQRAARLPSPSATSSRNNFCAYRNAPPIPSISRASASRLT
ncbi:MAG: hypothetical protein U0521_00680 [Anaerolineae bacterium]